jgi:hypothetical protein
MKKYLNAKKVKHAQSAQKELKGFKFSFAPFGFASGQVLGL